MVDQNDRLLSCGAGLRYVEQRLVKAPGLRGVSIYESAPGSQLILFNMFPILRENGEVHPGSLPARLRANVRRLPELRNLVRRFRT